MRIRWFAHLLSASILLSWAGVTRAEGLAQITLTIDQLAAVELPDAKPGVGYVSGRALAHPGDLELFDVVFLIDTSGSTGRRSGVDLERDPRWRQMPKKLRRSILGAEVAGIEALLDHFDPRTTRVGLVSFSGGDAPGTDHAWVEVPLSDQYGRVRTGLREILMAGPEGGTNMRAGLRRAGIELLGNRSAASEPRPGSARHIVLLTDGEPTLPKRDPDRQAILRAHKLARQRIRVHTFAIGPEATRRPRAAVEVASVTGGSYTPVRDPRDLQSMLAQVDFSDLREVRVTNKTLGRDADELVRNPDGTYGALVPVVEGVNQISVVAVTREGAEREVERTLTLGGQPMTARQRLEQRRLVALSVDRERKQREREREVEIVID